MVAHQLPRLLGARWALARPGSKIGVATICASMLCALAGLIMFMVAPEVMQGWIGSILIVAVPSLILLGTVIYIGQNFLPDAGYKASRELREAYKNKQAPSKESEQERDDAPKK